ncbi:hypothetical protein [Nodosilinea sp. FACHB-13]|uniref:hypothetical protein n=1 Tax=Cyanophyceae TaxID=3028117 RepID=UPI001689C1F3|nr:hypothetical protein [Nodosilinea sp. FACHB-13]MBD2107417.1 hypothetical protein [Nodosilinea sp. FACHB-13]
MTSKTADRLFNLSAHVERIVHLGYMASDSTSEALRDFLEEIDHQELGRLLSLSDEEQDSLSEILSHGDLLEIVTELGKSGFLLEVQGRIYRQVSPGHYTGTCSSAVAYAYAPKATDIDAAINKALDHLEPRLREPAESVAE